MKLLRVSPETREKYNDRYKYILVDEYQDTNSLQFASDQLSDREAAEYLCRRRRRAEHLRIPAGGHSGTFSNLRQQFPNAKVILLEQNYRSTQTILDAADAIIDEQRKPKEKEALDRKSRRRTGLLLPGLRRRRRGDDLSRRRSRTIAAAIRATVSRCFTARTRNRVLFEEALRRLRIEYNIVGGFSFYERAEVKDVIAYLKLAMNPFDDIALLRVINTPPRGLGKTSLDELQMRARRAGGSLWETIKLSGTARRKGALNLTPRAKNSLDAFRTAIEKLQAKVEEYH